MTTRTENRALRVFRAVLVASTAMPACGSEQSLGRSADSGGSGTYLGSEIYEVAISAPSPLDVLFMVDNSPGMEEEQASLAKSFPSMLQALQSLPNGLPNLHLGVVDCDAGSGYVACASSQPNGDRGLLWGNPTDGQSYFANVTSRRTSPAANGCGLSAGARWIEDIQNGRQRNYTGSLSDVFGCIAQVGTDMCSGWEHPLQAVRIALTGQPGNQGFLRPEAHLAIILLTDEDDCSADQTTDMFSSGVTTESASLRCAARGHVCDGTPIPYYDPENGFNPPDPDAQIGFQANFEKCAARTDTGLPLIQVDSFINDIKNLKDRPDEQISVAGIFGWPLPGTEDTAQYRIGKDLSAVHASRANLWDYLPICESPTFGKAYGGLRLKKFVDAFHGQTFSLCQGDLGDAMNRIGTAIAEKLGSRCLARWLVDTDGDPSNGLQPQCTVMDRVPASDGQSYGETPIPQCSDNSGQPCWRIDSNASACPITGRRIVIDRRMDANTAKPSLPPSGSQISVKCQACTDASDTKLCPRL